MILDIAVGVFLGLVMFAALVAVLVLLGVWLLNYLDSLSPPRGFRQ